MENLGKGDIDGTSDLLHTGRHMTPPSFDYLPAARRAILGELKRRGRATIPRIALDLGVSHEAVRRQLLELQRLGWVTNVHDEPAARSGAGRPAVGYRLTVAGDNLFRKDYDELVIALLDTAADPVKALTAVTNARVSVLARRVSGSRRRMDALRAIYKADDPFVEITRDGGDYLVIERNCPYLNVALERPIICSTTVSTLRRVTGREVVREERFQDGEGRCTFRITKRRGSASAFEAEPPKLS
jgi:predicted ArsR family transcriptional regulator